MRIGQVAAQAGVKTKALRYYERVGFPAAGRTDSGYRDYSEAALDRLRFIRAAQAVGLTLGEIKGIIGFREHTSPPCAHVLELIEARAADLDRRIDELTHSATNSATFPPEDMPSRPTPAHRTSSATSSTPPPPAQLTGRPRSIELKAWGSRRHGRDCGGYLIRCHWCA